MLHDALVVREGEHLALQVRWLTPLDGLVRVLMPAPDHTHGVVVVYSERRRQYDICKVMLHTGEVEWRTPVVNGGYGSPAFLDNLVIVHTEFAGVEALDWATGASVWRHLTDSRVRASITTETGAVVFSSGPHIIGLDSVGKELFRLTVPRAFFFGAVRAIDGAWISLATVTSAEGESRVRLICLAVTGEIRWEQDLGGGSIASSDTSGFVLEDGRVYVAGPDALFAFVASSGTVIWKQPIGKLAHRHSCVSDGGCIFYTTVEGRIGAVSHDGVALWERALSRQGVWSPASVLGDRIAVLANGMLHLLEGTTGAVVQKIAVGQTPYSALTFRNGLAFLGAGDPPYHGLIIGFDVQTDPVQPLSCSFTQERRVIDHESFADLVLQVSGSEVPIERVTVDFSPLEGPQRCEARRRDCDRFILSVSLGRGQRWGAYALPVTVETTQGPRVTTAFLELESALEGPSRVVLPGYDNIVQENMDWSGAALMAAVRRQHGDSVEQRDMRQMVDAVRERSGYLSFDTWRIAARRALSTSARTVSAMPEFRDEK